MSAPVDRPDEPTQSSTTPTRSAVLGAAEGQETAAGLPVTWDSRPYGVFTVRQYDDGRMEAVGDVPDRCAFSTQLLGTARPEVLTWDGRRITVTLANGTWSWDAVAISPDTNTVYAVRSAQ